MTTPASGLCFDLVPNLRFVGANFVHSRPSLGNISKINGFPLPLPKTLS